MDYTLSMELIIPMSRPQHLSNIIKSLNLTKSSVELITLISNLKCKNTVASDYPVRQLFFETSYSTGPATVGLKRNIGAWWAKSEDVLFFDDDQLASEGMTTACNDLFDSKDYFFGHHRFIDYDKYSVEQIVKEKPEDHITREHPANSHHTFQSGYGGLMGIKRDLYIALGGTDLWHSNVQSQEDTDFTRRLMIAKGIGSIFIHEPPFAWHPLWGVENKLPITATPANICSSHDIIEKELAGIQYVACTQCPWHQAPRQPMTNSYPLMPFNPINVQVKEKWL